jgi:N utilization substance protein B
MLFQVEASTATAELAIALFWRHFEADPEGRQYADELVLGISDKRAEVDARIVAASANWRLERMTRVDRNVMRLGAYELMYRPDVPRAVILDEAVELAKTYGSEESSSFVNGVLARIADDIARKDEASKAEPR